MSFRTTSQTRIGQSTTITSENLASARGTSGPAIINVIVTDSNFNNLDDTAVGTSNSFIKIIGTGFSANANVYIGGTLSSSANVTFVNSTQLNVTLPNLTSGTNNTLSLFNTNGSGAIYVSPILASGFPSFSTTSYTAASLSVSVQLLATGDAPLTYSLKAGSSLPSGLTLSSSGLISGTATSTSVTTFTVLVDDAQAQTFQQDITLTVTSGETYFPYNGTLINGDGTNGAQNNTFLDSSTNNFTITRNGNTTQGSFSPYGNLWSNYLPNSTYLVTSSSIGSFSGNFTFEGWTYFTATSSQNRALFCIGDDSTSSGMAFTINDNGSVVICNNGSNIINGFSAPSSLNQWVHWAVVRSGSTLTIYRNGTSLTTVSMSNTLSGVLYTGVEKYSTTFDDYAIGYISNLRVTNTAVYTTAFTPSTTPLTAISGTQYLGSQANRFLDASTNNATVTTSGSPSVQRFSPFNPTAPYSTTTIGGSSYSDTNNGSSNLSISNNTAFAIGGGDFTLSFWMYPLNTSISEAWILTQCDYGSNTGWSVFQNGATIKFRIGNTGGTYQSSSALIANAWQYIQINRSSGTMTMYCNGVSIYSGSVGNFTDATAYPFQIGGITSSTGWNNNLPFNGYLTDARVIKGLALSVTVPTAPVTNTNSPSVLANMTNAGIPDLAMQNDWITNGGTQVNTSVKKFGTGSLYMNSGSLQCFPYYNASGINKFAGDFTWEYWFYPTNNSNTYQGGGISYRDSSFSTGGFQTYYNGSTGELHFVFDGGGVDMYNSGINNNAWNHVALTRQNGTLRLFYNGVQRDSHASYNTVITGGGSSTLGFFIGDTFDGNHYYVQGYLDDIRITNGYARYVANFTPPTAALQTN